MKSLMILLLSLLSTIALSAQSQQSKTESPFGTPMERAKLQTEKMKAALPLRTDQIDKIYTLNLKYAKIMQKEVFDQGASQWTMYTKGSEINKRKEKELKPMLSEAQLKNYEKLKAEMRKQMLNGEKPRSLDDFK
ncbi:hypothetical protein [Haliscomenobacter sp.]|uniref:hypothetical protein n=1 Tax=Haliscomenobacter sp. TaxID=2717303 RepID=UPI003593EF69